MPKFAKNKKNQHPRFMSFSRLGLDKEQLACMRQWEKCILTDLIRGIGTYDDVTEMTRVEDGRLGKKFTATRNIPNHTLVGWYKGDVLEANDPRANINYVVELPSQDIGQGKTPYWLDGSKWLHDEKANIIFINHSCLDFNCEMHAVVLPTHVYNKKKGLYHQRTITAFYIIAMTIRDIAVGEELLTNYDSGGSKSPDQFQFFNTEAKQLESLRCDGEHPQAATSMIQPCECRTEGCPLNYVYVKKNMPENSGSDGDNSNDKGTISESSDEESPPPAPIIITSYKKNAAQKPLKKRRNLYYDKKSGHDHSSSQF